MQNFNLVFNIDDVSDTYIEAFAKEFIDKNIKTINRLCFSVYKENSKLSILAFQEIMFAEVKKACYSFVNNNHDPKYIESYLFACVQKTIKSLNNESKSNVYVCPACKYFSKIEILEFRGKKFHCNSCRIEFDNAKNEWEKVLFGTFCEYNKKGHRCPDCENFIPIQNNNIIKCPYPNCCFVGNSKELEPMRHPTIKANLEIPSLNRKELNSNKSPDTEMMVGDNFKSYLNILNDIIDAQSAILHFKSNASTMRSKLCMYQAYKNIIAAYPEEMISYLIFLNRNIRIQHKIFQEFVRLLEAAIPFSFTMSGKVYEVKSLLDDNLCVFDGVSEFVSIVDENGDIPNATQELYVGGRKGSYCRPYYIGKVIDIIDIDTNETIFHKMKEYTFFKIVMQEDMIGKNVMVKTYLVPPHYQMKSMVYLNRIRRAIVDKAYFTINGRKRVIKR
jgi:hypothetical protein